MFFIETVTEGPPYQVMSVVNVSAETQILKDWDSAPELYWVSAVIEDFSVRSQTQLELYCSIWLRYKMLWQCENGFSFGSVDINTNRTSQI